MHDNYHYGAAKYYAARTIFIAGRATFGKYARKTFVMRTSARSTLHIAWKMRTVFLDEDGA